MERRTKGVERRTRTGGTADQRGRAGFFFGFMAFWPGLEIGFFLTREVFFRADARILFLVFSWCFFGVFCCFLLFFGGVFVLFDFFGVFRALARKKIVFFSAPP